MEDLVRRRTIGSEVNEPSSLQHVCVCERRVMIDVFLQMLSIHTESKRSVGRKLQTAHAEKRLDCFL